MKALTSYSESTLREAFEHTVRQLRALPADADPGLRETLQATARNLLASAIERRSLN